MAGSATGARWAQARGLAAAAAGLLALAAVSLVHVRQGAAGLGLAELWSVLAGGATGLEAGLLLDVRLPRVAAGVLAGASLGVSGTLLQTATRNPMASPATLAVNAGAYLAVVAVGLLWAAAPIPPFVTAFAGGLLAAALVLGAGVGAGGTPTRIVLAGVAVALALTSVTSALLILNETATTGLHLWGAGSLVQAGWDRVTSALAPALLGLVAALVMGRSLDVYELGDTAARVLGQRVGRVRVTAMAVAVLLAAAATAVVGPVAFVGLLVPNVLRQAGIRAHRTLVAASAAWGAVLLVGADAATRAIHGPVQELPAGVVTALLGAPFLAYLALRRPTTGDQGDPSSLLATHPDDRPPYAWAGLGLALVLGAGVLAGLSWGAVPVGVGGTLRAVLFGGSGGTAYVVLDLRAPRVAVAAAAGAALAGAGLLLQDALRNPLASPTTLGVAPSAGLAGLAAVLLVPGLPSAAVALAAAAGALAGLALVVVAAWTRGLTAERVILVGVAAAAATAAASQLLVVTADVRVARALVWLSGSTYGAGPGEARLLVAAVLGLSALGAGLLRPLDALALGDDAAGGLGLPPRRTRAAALALSAGLTGAAVAVVGPVAFVGLAAPHAARLLAGPATLRRAPLALGLGALLVVAADAVGRGLLAPTQLPVGLVTSLVGAPYFGYLLLRSARAGPA